MDFVYSTGVNQAKVKFSEPRGQKEALRLACPSPSCICWPPIGCPSHRSSDLAGLFNLLQDIPLGIFRYFFLTMCCAGGSHCLQNVLNFCHFSHFPHCPILSSSVLPLALVCPHVVARRLCSRSIDYKKFRLLFFRTYREVYNLELLSCSCNLGYHIQSY